MQKWYTTIQWVNDLEKCKKIFTILIVTMILIVMEMALMIMIDNDDCIKKLFPYPTKSAGNFLFCAHFLSTRESTEG